jgi:hypothetical protein
VAGEEAEEALQVLAFQQVTHERLGPTSRPPVAVRVRLVQDAYGETPGCDKDRNRGRLEELEMDINRNTCP